MARPTMSVVTVLKKRYPISSPRVCVQITVDRVYGSETGFTDLLWHVRR